MNIGDLVRSTKFDLSFKNDIARGTARIGVKDKKDFLVFIYMGTEPQDGSDPVDVTGLMGYFGWGRLSSKKQKEAQERFIEKLEVKRKAKVNGHGSSNKRSGDEGVPGKTGRTTKAEHQGRTPRVSTKRSRSASGK